MFPWIAVSLWGIAVACTGDQAYDTGLTESDTILTITLCKDYNNTKTLKDIWDNDVVTTAVSKLTIDGNGYTWTDFQYKYSYFTGTPLDSLRGNLTLTNIRLVTDGSIDYYAVYSKNTQVYMDTVHIEGYSGNADQVGGGAMRIRATEYPDETGYTAPSFRNVTVHNCCRGFRIQDTTNFYCVGCHVENVTDNALYFATGTWPYSINAAFGCKNSTFADSSVKNAGQSGILMIGGSGNAVINTTITNTRGGGASFFHSNGVNTLDNVTFTGANSAHTEAPWGGTTDDFNGATVGVSIDCGTSEDCASTIVLNGCILNGGGVLTPGTIELWNNDNKPGGGARNSGDGIAAADFANADTWADGIAAAPLSVATYVSSASDAVNFHYTDNFYNGTNYIAAACANGPGTTQACTDTNMRTTNITTLYTGGQENETLALELHQALFDTELNGEQVTAAEVAAVVIAVVKTAATAQLTLSLNAAHVSDCKLDAMAKKAEDELKKTYDVVTVTCTGVNCDNPQVCSAAGSIRYANRSRRTTKSINFEASSGSEPEAGPVWMWIAVGIVSVVLLLIIVMLCKSGPAANPVGRRIRYYVLNTQFDPQYM